VPRIINVKRSESEVALVEIRGDRLVGIINFEAIKVPVNVAVVAVNQKIGTIADFQLKPLAQQVVKEVIMFVQVSPEIAEIDPNPSFHRESIERYPAMATVFSVSGNGLGYAEVSKKQKAPVKSGACFGLNGMC